MFSNFRSGFVSATLLAVVLTSVSSCEGPTGPAGAAGTPGMPGAPALSGLQIPQVQGTVPGVNDVAFASQRFIHLRVECPSGTKVIGGGFRADGDGSQFVSAFNSFPVSPTAWQISVYNQYVGSVKITAYATCIAAS